MTDKKVIPSTRTESNPKLDEIVREQKITNDKLLQLSTKDSISELSTKIDKMNDTLSAVLTTITNLAETKKAEQAEAKTATTSKNTNDLITKYMKVSGTLPVKGVASSQKGKPGAKETVTIKKEIYTRMSIQTVKTSKKWGEALAIMMRDIASKIYNDTGVRGYSAEDMYKSFNDLINKYKEFSAVSDDVLLNRIDGGKTNNIKSYIDIALMKSNYTKADGGAESTQKLMDAYYKFHMDIAELYLTKIDGEKEIKPEELLKLAEGSKKKSIEMKFEETKLYHTLAKKYPITDADKPVVPQTVEDKKTEGADDSSPAEVVDEDDPKF